MFSNDLVIKILKYIDLNLYKKITIYELSNTFNYNKDYIMRIFKKETSMTIIDYINKKRIFNSLQAYETRYLSILNISFNYGFFSQEYYCEIFHKIIGVPPTAYYKFINLRSSLSLRDLGIIQTNLSKLDYQLRKIDDYIMNIPPKSTVKVLSIFK